MSDFDNTNRGVLFKNDKEGNEKRPDYTGTINVNGEEMRLAAWIRKSAKGVTYMSLNVSEQQNAAPKVASHDPEFNDEIPF